MLKFFPETERSEAGAELPVKPVEKYKIIVEKCHNGCYNETQGNQDEAVFTLFNRRESFPPDERKEGLLMITYGDFFQFCLFVVALVGLCYTIFHKSEK